MSFDCRSLSGRILHGPCSAWLPRRRISPGVVGLGLKQPLRVVNAVRSEATGVTLLNEAAPPVSNVFGSSAKEVESSEGPAGFIRSRVERKVQSVKQALQSVEEAVAPSPFSPAEGEGVVGFILVSVFLFLLFWVGNYLAPTWIFKETVFRNSKGNLDDNAEEFAQGDDVLSSKPSEEVDPADLIELPTNLQPFRGIAVRGFKAGRERARQETEKRFKKKTSGKSK